ADPAVIAIRGQTATIATSPEANCRLLRQLFQLASQDATLLDGADPHGRRPRARLEPGAIISLPATQAGRPLDVQSNPAIEDDEVVPARRPFQRPADADAVEVEQVHARLVDPG